MIKHSDAPWAARSVKGRYYVYDANDCTVCTVARWTFPVDGTDARLIAAAPDLLETLKFVASDPCFSCLGSVTHDEVRAAIAKAERAP